MVEKGILFMINKQLCSALYCLDEGRKCTCSLTMATRTKSVCIECVSSLYSDLSYKWILFVNDLNYPYLNFRYIFDTYANVDQYLHKSGVLVAKDV